MPGMSGLEALRRLRADAIAAKVIFLTMHADAQLAAEALRAGASGFVVKHAAGKELIAAIHTVLRGGTYVTPQLASDVLTTLGGRGHRRARATLTPRQREVVSLIAEGRTMKEVAAALGLSPRTVETHKYQVMAALGLQTTAELIRYAIEHGLDRRRPARLARPSAAPRLRPAPASGVLLTVSVILRIVGRGATSPTFARMDRPRVVLAEDHARIAEQLRALLEPEFDVVATVADGHALLRAADDAPSRRGRHGHRDARSRRHRGDGGAPRATSGHAGRPRHGSRRARAGGARLRGRRARLRLEAQRRPRAGAGGPRRACAANGTCLPAPAAVGLTDVRGSGPPPHDVRAAQSAVAERPPAIPDTITRRPEGQGMRDRKRRLASGVLALALAIVLGIAGAAGAQQPSPTSCSSWATTSAGCSRASTTAA